MKYAYILAQKENYSISKMLDWLSVSRSGYYDWIDREPSQQAKRRERLKTEVIALFHELKQRCGSPKITVELNARGFPCSENLVAEIMAECDLKAKKGKGYAYFPAIYANTNVSSNLLKRNFTAEKPNQKWVADITYIKVAHGFAYLAAIMDLFSRKVVGWTLGENMTAELVITAYQAAVANRNIEPGGLILHTDRGVQYRSTDYLDAITEDKVIPSMSRKGNCWDNAVIESFFSRLKVEAIYGYSFHYYNEVYSCVFEYIELFYNPVRRHQTIGYLSPNEFEQNYKQKCA